MSPDVSLEERRSGTRWRRDIPGVDSWRITRSARYNIKSMVPSHGLLFHPHPERREEYVMIRSGLTTAAGFLVFLFFLASSASAYLRDYFKASSEGRIGQHPVAVC